MRVSNILDVIVAWSQEADLCLEPAYILERLDVHAPGHEHLRNPQRQADEFQRPRRRRSPLTGSETIDSDMLLFTFGGHDERVDLHHHSGLHSIEMAIMSEAGIFNPFANLMIPIIAGRSYRYRLFSQDVSLSIRDLADCEYASRRIDPSYLKFEWLDTPDVATKPVEPTGISSSP